MKKSIYPVKKCTVCGEKFESYAKVSGAKHKKIRRPVKAVTCSKFCSAENARKQNRIRIALRRREKK